MYTANRRLKKRRIFLKFMLFAVPFLAIIGVIIWFIFIRGDTTTSANFSQKGVEIAVVKPETKEFTNELFKITLPTSWASLGKKNPHSYEVYYEFQNKVKNYDNRWIKIYVDVFPKDMPINKLLPVSVVNNKIVPGVQSDDCHTFTGAPLSGGGDLGALAWRAKWQGVDFICDMEKKLQNNVGTASAEEGYGLTLVSKDGTQHKYFFVYTDHNVRPDYTVFNDALKSFETL